MASLHNEPVVVLGLGRFGSSLALELASRGTEVLGIDTNPKIVDELAGRLTNVATADCTDSEALRQLGVPDFQRAVVAIGTDLEASVLATVLLTDLGIPHIWAKALNRRHAEILRRSAPTTSCCPSSTWASGWRTCCPGGCSTTSRSTRTSR